MWSWFPKDQRDLDREPAGRRASWHGEHRITFKNEQWRMCLHIRHSNLLISVTVCEECTVTNPLPRKSLNLIHSLLHLTRCGCASP